MFYLLLGMAWICMPMLSLSSPSRASSLPMWGTRKNLPKFTKKLPKFTKNYLNLQKIYLNLQKFTKFKNLLNLNLKIY